MRIIKTAIYIAILILGLQEICSQTLLLDDFSYPVRDSLEGVGGWFRSGANSPFNVKVVTPGLTYSGYAGSGIGNCVLLTNDPNGDIVLHSFTTQTTGNLYMAIMVMVDSMTQTATQGYNIGFDQAGGTTNLNTRLYMQKVTSSTFKMGINKTGTTTYTIGNYNTNTTYLVVLKYSFVNGNDNDSCKLYIFSSGVPATEPAAPDAFTTVGSDLPDEGEVFISNLYAQGAPALANSPVRIDGLRIGTTWNGTIFTTIKQISSEIPSTFSLEQNYPNPFNPSTKIMYKVENSSNVTIKLYDILARELRTVVNEYHNPGTYEIEVNAADLSSGSYFYMMKAENLSAGSSGQVFVSVKKMVLVK